MSSGANLKEHRLIVMSEMRRMKLDRKRRSSGVDAAKAHRGGTTSSSSVTSSVSWLVSCMRSWKDQGLASSSQEQPGDPGCAGSIWTIASSPRQLVRTTAWCWWKVSAHDVPLKGGDTKWVSEQGCRDLRKFGISGDVVFKTALVDLMKQICALSKDRV